VESGLSFYDFTWVVNVDKMLRLSSRNQDEVVDVKKSSGGQRQQY